jgi:hypothetical protein
VITFTVTKAQTNGLAKRRLETGSRRERASTRQTKKESEQRTDVDKIDGSEVAVKVIDIGHYQ